MDQGLAAILGAAVGATATGAAAPTSAATSGRARPTSTNRSNPRRRARVAEAVRTTDLVADPLMLATRWSTASTPPAVTAEQMQAFDRGMEALAQGLARFADAAREST